MRTQRFSIKLHEAHKKSGLTVYAVAQKLGMNFNTVNKYVSEDLLVERLPPEIEKIAAFYGLDWRDPAVVHVIEIEAKDQKSGQIKTLLVPA